MPEAVIVSGARTAVGKATKGSLRTVRPDDMAAAAIRAAVERAPGLDPNEIDDVIIGCAMPEAQQGLNVARLAALRAGLPDRVPAQTVNRFCSSGLQTIALAAHQIMAGQGEVIVAGGTESMSMVSMSGNFFSPNPDLVNINPEVYMPMGLTAEEVAQRFNVSRQDQDEFALRSHRNAAAAMDAGKFDEEITPLEVSVTQVRWRARVNPILHLPDRRGRAARHLAGSAGQAQASLPRARHDHCRQRFADQRWRGRRRGDERGQGQAARP
ncbi:MAG: hypothetical protein KatS3mg052_2755 [Candidatus Roseilinea sp.]|nr:MAG: hypothetical protein KatS3mg052_2755 [Candidatus Roseilinea sp.]